MNDELQFGFGADSSKKDDRTVQHEEISMVSPTLLVKGGYEYKPEQVENQAKVGICTAISLTQNRERALGKKFSADFQYLLQKKFYDKQWAEGSSIQHALACGLHYGFLPEELWTHTTQKDREGSYALYIAKLQAIPEAEITRLIGLCGNKIDGYAQVNINDPQALAKAINDSDAGIIARFEVGKEWFTPSWKEKDINPLKNPKSILSGHAINMTAFNYEKDLRQVLTNTWSPLWCRNGSADVLHDKYKPTEAWLVTDLPDKVKEAIHVVATTFTKDLKIGMTDPQVQKLQQFLNSHGYPVTKLGEETLFFGPKTQQALINFQKANGIPNTGYFGSITRGVINKILK